jgi:DivIVA domain-containing protein
VPLDRQTIEKKDFPISRRGYDPDAVDAHLRSLAGEVEELKRASRRRPESLAAAASEEVQAIVAAAESAASKIQSDAENEAAEIRREARNEAKSSREEATTQAREYVEKVSESSAALLQRVEAIERELGAVVDSLRGAGKRLQSELGELEGTLTELGDAVSPRATAAAPATPPSRVEYDEDEDEDEDSAGYDEDDDDGGDYDDEPGFDEPEEGELTAAPRNGNRAEPVAEEPVVAEVAVEASGGGESEADGARLIALNMALNGAPRDEVDRYLAENFELSDRGRLIDEVYAAIED